jgi:FAD/FMN-containing dehydrogenase
MNVLLSGLSQSLAGELLLPGSDGYEQSRTVWNAMVDRRPAAIARPTSAEDVARAVRFARDHSMEIGIRGGGHSATGLAVPNGGLMIDLGALGSVRVDPVRRRAWVGGGAELGELDRAAQRHGLATTAGNVSHTGVGGLTLGGGMGWLARQLGLSCDNVESYQVVTSEGSVIRASRTERPDLFWGLRGGGGNFGVVTEFEFRLHPVGTMAVVADFAFDLKSAHDALRGWAELIPQAPRQAMFTASAGRDAEGGPWATVGYVWVGDAAEGRRLLPGFRSLGPAVSETVREMTYIELQSVDDVPAGFGKRRYSKGHYLEQLSDGAIDAFLSVATSGVAPLHGGFQALGGAIAEVADEDSAFSYRSMLVDFGLGTGWTDPREDEKHIAAARRYGAAMEPFASGAYVNNLGDERDAGVLRAYTAAKLQKLATLKARYDPDNVFHLNQNIAPSRAT